MENTLIVSAFIFGSMIGSFLNVLIYRLPKNENIVFPRSACPHCKNAIPWYLNFPILSFLFLRGKCFYCKAKISALYPLIELMTGVACIFFIPAQLSNNAFLTSILYFSIFCIFLVHFVIDIKHQILPDGLNIALALIFMVLTLLNNSWQDWHHWPLGGLIGFGFPYLITWLFYVVRGQIGLGGGDIKLFGCLGLYLGPMGIIYNIFLSCVLGSIIGVSLIVFKIIDRKSPIPFGPFILLTASFQIFFPKYFSILISFIMP